MDFCPARGPQRHPRAPASILSHAGTGFSFGRSLIQALDRTAPCLPVLPTTQERRTHDYVRNGTTSLFAAVASGSVIAQRYRNARESIALLAMLADELVGERVSRPAAARQVDSANADPVNRLLSELQAVGRVPSGSGLRLLLGAEQHSGELVARVEELVEDLDHVRVGYPQWAGRCPPSPPPGLTSLIGSRSSGVRSSIAYRDCPLLAT